MDPYATLVFQTTAADVRTVLVDGRIVKRDGVLTEVARLPRERLPLLVQRFKVLAGLLTYRSDVPQDGRVAAADSPAGAELRVRRPSEMGVKALGHQHLFRRGNAAAWPEIWNAALDGI